MFIIRNTQKYEQVFHPLETSYEDVVRQQLRHCLPTFHVVKFAPFVQPPEGRRRRPDLALVHKDYRLWVIAEVELEHHSLQHHVRPQIEAFSDTSFSERHVRTLKKNEPQLDSARLKDLVLYSPPEIAVIVNSRSVVDKGWTELEVELDAHLMFIELYKSPSEDVLVTFSGWLPEAQPRLLSTARKVPMLNALKCRRTDLLPINDGTLRMRYEERPLDWSCTLLADGAILIPLGSNVTVKEGRNYEIVRTDEGHIRLQFA